VRRFEAFKQHFHRGAATPASEHSERRRGFLRLALALCAVGAVWLGVLPAVSRRPGMQALERLYDSYGIDPGAMVYTELDAADSASIWAESRKWVTGRAND
jgi:hypothetical protein